MPPYMYLYKYLDVASPAGCARACGKSVAYLVHLRCLWIANYRISCSIVNAPRNLCNRYPSCSIAIRELCSMEI
eukprot:jgi/Botrbrau1/7780/Bobra.0159s0208.1